MVITDAGSHPELVACASHFWSSGSVITIVIGASWLLLVGHWGPWVCVAGTKGYPIDRLHWIFVFVLPFLVDLVI